MTANDIKPDGRFFGLFVGESSSGKSCSAASFPKPILILDTDLRKGIIDANKWGVPLDQIEIKRFTPKMGYAELEKELKLIDNLITLNQCPYKTIMVDSLTSLSRLFMTDAYDLLKGQVLNVPGANAALMATLRMSGAPDYKYEKAAMLNCFDFLRSWPLHVIVMGHTVPRYRKLNPENDYSETVQDGTRVCLTENLTNNILIYFDEAYEFFKSSTGDRFYVQFRSSIGRTLFSDLPTGRLDITGKNFYETWLSYVQKGQK